MKTKQIANHILLPETTRLITEGHTVTHIVRGNSMNPFLTDRRDKVILSPFNKDSLKSGTVVLALDDADRFVVHRIIARNNDKLLLMGDGSLKTTEQTTPDRVAGVVTAVIRKNRTYPCTGSVWKIYSYIWVTLLPLRRILLGIWRRTRHFTLHVKSKKDISKKIIIL